MSAPGDDERSAQDLVREALLRARADSTSRDPSKVARPTRTPRPRRDDDAPQRGPAPVGGLLREWVADRGVDVDVAVARITACWSDVVGPEVANHCRADNLEAGVLHVVAESTAWATNLRLLSSTLLERVRAEVVAIAGPQAAQELVREIRITGPRSPSWKKGRLSVQGRGPRDTYG